VSYFAILAGSVNHASRLQDGSQERAWARIGGSEGDFVVPGGILVLLGGVEDLRDPATNFRLGPNTLGTVEARDHVELEFLLAVLGEFIVAQGVGEDEHTWAGRGHRTYSARTRRRYLRQGCSRHETPESGKGSGTGTAESLTGEFEGKLADRKRMTFNK
jgi:hypothetical protein